jgi:hypothetical protein
MFLPSFCSLVIKKLDVCVDLAAADSGIILVLEFTMTNESSQNYS